MSVAFLSNGTRTRYHYLKTDPNGNLILKHAMDDEFSPNINTYIQEDYTPGFDKAKSVLTQSWTSNQHKTYIWEFKKMPNNGLYPKEVREQRIDRILLTMFGYSDVSKPTIETILRKTRNSQKDAYEVMSDKISWEYGEYEPRRKDIEDEDYYLNHPNRQKYISMLEDVSNSRKKSRSTKKSVVRKPKKVIKKCKCKK